MPAGRPAATACKRGHVYDEVGRYTNGRCRACAMKTDNPPPLRNLKNAGICRRGHKLTPGNRYRKNGRWCCVACGKANGRIFRTTVEVAPLSDFMAQHGLTVRDVGRTASIVLKAKPASIERVLHRAMERGRLSIAAADDLCVGLGLHPFEVYGPAWFTYGQEVANAV